MANFDRLKKLQVTDKNVVNFELPELGKDAVLNVRSASEGNAGYMNGLLRLNGQAKGSRRRRTTVVDAESLAEMRENDKTLFPEHVIVGWENVLDDSGKEVKFSAKEVADLLSKLPGYVFDELRMFASDPENFIAVIDSEDLGKN